MARARPPQDDQDDRAEKPPGGDEQITALPGSRDPSTLFGSDDAMRRLVDPRSASNATRADATAKNRREHEHVLASARTIGGDAFRALERSLRGAKDAILEAADGADLPALQAAYKKAKAEHDEAMSRWAGEATKRAEVRRYVVLDNNAGKARLASTRGSIGQARFPPGKEVDTLNHDVPALRKQGIKLDELPPDEIAAAG